MLLNGLDLFSGIAGITKALEQWVRPVAYCECERYAQGVLLSRMAEGDIPTAPIWDDIKTLNSEVLKPLGEIQIIYGGWPCQGCSTAGMGRGMDDERSKLIQEVIRLAEEVRPKFIFLENVTGVRTKQIYYIGEELARIGYDLRWDIVSAREAGADHLRKRIFFLAHRDGSGFSKESPSPTEKDLKGIRKGYGRPEPSPYCRGKWSNTPKVCRTSNEVPFRLERIMSLGNAVVPDQVTLAFKRLMGLK